MSDLRLAIVECCYPNIVQDELSKDQFIFGLAVKEIQDHLLGEIVAEDSSEKFLLESWKIESKIEKKILLGIKTAMTYGVVQSHRGRNKFRSKSQDRGRSLSSIRNCKYCGKSHNKGNVQLLAKSVKSVEKTTTLKMYAKVVMTVLSIIIANIDHPKVKGTKNRLFLVRLIFILPRCIPRFLRY